VFFFLFDRLSATICLAYDLFVELLSIKDVGLVFEHLLLTSLSRWLVTADVDVRLLQQVSCSMLST